MRRRVGDRQVFPVLLALPLPHELWVQRRITGIEHVIRHLLFRSHKVPRGYSVGMVFRVSLCWMESTGVDRVRFFAGFLGFAMVSLTYFSD